MLIPDLRYAIRSLSRARGFTVAVILNFLHVPYTESQASRVVLAMLGSLLPLLVAYLAFGRFRQLRRTADLALVTALALLGFTNLLFGVVPALSAGRSDPQATLRDESRGTSESRRSRRLRGALSATRILAVIAAASITARSSSIAGSNRS
jgi:putative ABC transport system permease protein